MDLNTMRTMVRRDLKDEDSENYRWTDEELDRHIAHALKEFSEAVPLPAKATLPTTSSSREIDMSSLTDRVVVEAVEYPVDKFPPRYQRFTLWGHVLTLFGDEVPDGSNWLLVLRAMLLWSGPPTLLTGLMLVVLLPLGSS